MFKKSLLTVVALGFLGAFASAASAIVPPKVCPSINKLNKTIFTWAEFSEETNEYVALNISDYGTSNRWGFVIARINANDEASALKLANKSLSSLAGKPAPYQFQGEQYWECNYAIGNGYIAVTVTPVPANVKRFVH